LRTVYLRFRARRIDRCYRDPAGVLCAVRAPSLAYEGAAPGAQERVDLLGSTAGALIDTARCREDRSLLHVRVSNVLLLQGATHE
jgi:hypothetical protein